MPAPAGNKFWEQRSSHGRKPKFASPDELLDACHQYFTWAEENPLQEEKAFHYQGEVIKDTVNKMRALTLGGMFIYVDIDRTTWYKYREDKDFSTVCAAVEEAIRDQKFVGAAADLLNANIIARDLGLSDKTELTGKDGKDLNTDPMEVAKNLLFGIQATLKKGLDQAKDD